MSPKDTIQEIPIKKAKGLISQGAYILDVRQPEEYEEVHIQDCNLLPLPYLCKESLEEKKIPKDKEILVYCKKGIRSMKAAEMMIELGYKNLYSLEGGIVSFLEAEDYEILGSNIYKLPN